MVEGQPFTTALLFLVIIIQHLFFTNFIKKMKEEHSLQIKSKTKAIEKLENKFLDFQFKMIALLTRFEQSLTNTQNHDMKNQQAIKEVTSRVASAELKIENLLIRLYDKLESMSQH